MLCLALDTSTKTGGAAVVDRSNVLGEYVLDVERKTHSERLIPAIDSVLSGIGIKIKDIGAIAVAYGPGSFTGLRIGIATAKALALSLNIPLYKVDTLEALAYQVSFLDGVIVPIFNARRNEIYGSVWESDPKEGSFVCLRDSEALSLNEFLQYVPKSDKLYFLGEGSLALENEIKEHFQNAYIIKGTNSILHPASIGIRALTSGIDPVDADQLVPNYLRKSEAEIKKEGFRVE